MTGKNNFMFKAVGLFLNSDKMVGGMFEEDLAECWKMNFEEAGITLCRTLTEEPDLLERVISSLESAVLDVPPPSNPTR